MEDVKTWCTERHSDLLDEELRIRTLAEIKEYLSTLPPEKALEIIEVLQLPLVFDCLNDSKTEQIDLACDVLSMCMATLSLNEIASKYGPSLERSMNHPAATVKLMALKKIRLDVENPEMAVELSLHTSLLLAIINCISDEDLSVAEKSSEIIAFVGKTPIGLKCLLTTQIKGPILQLSSVSEIVRFRVYDIVIDIAIASDSALNDLLDSGLLSSLILELNSNDVLLKLNVIELLSRLAVCDHGFKYLEGQEIISKLEKDLISATDDVLGAITQPGLLKFFGNVIYWKPQEMHMRYPLVFTVLFDMLDSDNLIILGVALETLGHIAEKNQGKIILHQMKQSMQKVLKMLGKLGQLPTEVRLKCFGCIASLIDIEKHHQTNKNICNITQQWFLSLCEDPMTYFMQYATNPFEEIRVAAQNVLLAVARQSWGQELIKKQPGLVELLLDRSIEPTKQSKETKYEIIKALSESPIFDQNTIERFQQYVKEGPFYVHTVTEVATAGSG